MGTLSLTDYEEVRIWAPWGNMVGRWYGNRSDRPILAIHGWMDNMGTFDTLIPLLPDYLGVLCIDLPGHGCSGRLPLGMYYSADDWLFAIARIIKEYNWPKVSFLGHSLGGALAFMYASILPEMVDMVISLDIFMPFMESTDYFKSLVSAIERRLDEALDEPAAQPLDQLHSSLCRRYKPMPAEAANHLLHRGVTKSQLWPEKFYFSNDERTKYFHFFYTTPGLAVEMVKRIKNIPYLVIKATDTQFIYQKSSEALATLANQNPNFEYHKVPGTHHVHLTNPERCAQFILPFLKRHRPSLK